MTTGQIVGFAIVGGLFGGLMTLLAFFIKRKLVVMKAEKLITTKNINVEGKKGLEAFKELPDNTHLSEDVDLSKRDGGNTNIVDSIPASTPPFEEALTQAFEDTKPIQKEVVEEVKEESKEDKYSKRLESWTDDEIKASIKTAKKDPTKKEVVKLAKKVLKARKKK